MAAHEKQKKTRPMKAQTDVVGVEVGAGHAFGTPVVRLRRKADGIELTAAGFLPLLSDLPDDPADADADGIWVMPRLYAAPCAALAITSPAAVVRQASSVEDALSEEERRLYRAGVWESKEGGLALVAGIPDALGAWAARLLPEGRKPTVCSIQVSRLAWMNAFAVSRDFQQTNGTALLMLIGRQSSAIVIYHERHVILFREFSVGSEAVMQALCREMNLDAGTVAKLLEDDLVDPTASLEPVLAPLFRQVELSTDYAHRKNRCFVDRFFLVGTRLSPRYWAQVFKNKTGGVLIPCNPLDGIDRSGDATLPADFENVSHYFVPAAGAALAVLEDA